MSSKDCRSRSGTPPMRRSFTCSKSQSPRGGPKAPRSATPPTATSPSPRPSTGSASACPARPAFLQGLRDHQVTGLPPPEQAWARIGHDWGSQRRSGEPAAGGPSYLCGGDPGLGAMAISVRHGRISGSRDRHGVVPGASAEGQARRRPMLMASVGTGYPMFRLL
jgi:hypothetical protein